MSLVVQNLSKTFDRKIAVDNISFEINQGETIGILGPNGTHITIEDLPNPNAYDQLVCYAMLNTGNSNNMRRNYSYV